MEKPLQLLLPLSLPDDRIPLPSHHEERVVAVLAALLLQVRSVEKEEEAQDEHRA